MDNDIKEYRRQYYRDNKEYLLAYQRWYYSTRRYEAGLIEEKDIPSKPSPLKRKYAKEKKELKQMTKKYGTFIISFE